MIDLMCWRARIGVFINSKFRSVHRPPNVKCSHNNLSHTAGTSNCQQPVSVTDVLTAAVWLYLFVMLMWSLSVTVTAVHNAVVQNSTQFEQEALKKTMSADRDVFEVGQADTRGYRDLYTMPCTVLWCIASAASWLRKLLLVSGDVEQHPGPDTEQQQVSDTEKVIERNLSPDFESTILRAIENQTKQFQQALNEKIGECQKQQEQQNNDIRQGFNEIKTELNRISARCERLEIEQSQLSTKVNSVAEQVCQLQVKSSEDGNITDKLCTAVSSAENELYSINMDLDRLEEFSRRDNLRLFGIPQTVDMERYDDCAQTIIKTLNSVEGDKQWSEDDIIRAHRIGQAKPGQPRPIIAKFARWRDKMLLLQNKHLRSELETKGVRLANDLTRRQADTVARARQEGKVAYFKRGRLTIGPRRAEERTFTQATAGVTAAMWSESGSLTAHYTAASGDPRSDVTEAEIHDTASVSAGGNHALPPDNGVADDRGDSLSSQGDVTLIREEATGGGEDECRETDDFTPRDLQGPVCDDTEHNTPQRDVIMGGGKGRGQVKVTEQNKTANRVNTHDRRASVTGGGKGGGGKQRQSNSASGGKHQTGLQGFFRGQPNKSPACNYEQRKLRSDNK